MKTVTVLINGDTVLEPNETFTVTLGLPNHAGVDVIDGAGLGTIANDDAASISINNATVAEGNSGSTNAGFTVTLIGDVQGSFTVPVASTDGSAIAGSDYAAISPNSILNFTGSSGETASVVVAITSDSVVEGHETYSVNLGAPSNAAVSVSDGNGMGTITNDDTATVAIAGVVDAEGDSGASTFVFTATLTGTVQDVFTVPYQTSDGTAHAGSDYTAASGNLSFTGTNGQTRSVPVAVAGDSTPEFDETFHVDLSPPSQPGVIANPARGTATIVNDDLFADISVTNNNGVSALAPGQTTTYTVIVTNTSLVVDVPAVQISQSIPATLTSISWTCTSAGGATCPANGSGGLSTTLALPKGGTVTFLVTATVDPLSAGQSITATIIANVQAPYSDLNLTNNSAIDTDTVLGNVVFTNGFE
jgi:uncharacterized repeat protein (TIGR01451 family)